MWFSKCCVGRVLFCLTYHGLSPYNQKVRRVPGGLLIVLRSPLEINNPPDDGGYLQLEFPPWEGCDGLCGSREGFVRDAGSIEPLPTPPEGGNRTYPYF